MDKYLLIESRDPFETNEVRRDYDIAITLAKGGNRVTMFLVQNGVSASRRGAQSGNLSDVVASGVEVVADDFSLKERAITQEQLLAGISPAPIDLVVDQLAEGRKAIWL